MARNLAQQQVKLNMNRAYEQVKEFHKAFGHPVANKPVALTQARKEARAKWIREEIDEFLAAKDVVGQMDAIVDAIYFLLGSAVEIGVEPQQLFDIVQNANMSKLWPDGKPRYRDDGKVLNPISWQAPEPLLQKEIERQIAEKK